MTESRVLWLALGIVVGFMIWGERHHYAGAQPFPSAPNILSPIKDDGGFPPISTHCSDCGG